MLLSRRAFVRTVGLGAGGILSGRLFPDASPWLSAAGRPAVRPIPLHNNENPLGPGEAVLDAVRAALGGGAPAGRYPDDPSELRAAIARAWGVAGDNVMLGNGSTQLLRTATQVCTSGTRPLVTGAPSYEQCTEYAALVGTPVRAVPLDASLRLDLDAMAAAAAGAGMVFLNNPNNPSSTVHSGADVAGCINRIRRHSPDTVVLVDEAYHDYVTDPDYATQVGLAAATPGVLVSRTFSKAHGMAGLRLGVLVGHPETLRPMRAWQYGMSLNVLALAAGLASIEDPSRILRERDRNAEARAYTVDWFRCAGRSVAPSQGNFIFVDLAAPVGPFRDACRRQGVLIGRPFPPLTDHARISIGTLDEMRTAAEVFEAVL